VYDTFLLHSHKWVFLLSFVLVSLKYVLHIHSSYISSFKLLFFSISGLWVINA
jgi:hypothetical protein